MAARRISVVFAIVMGTLWPSPVDARETRPDITAELDGRRIKATEAGNYFCHDFSFPHVQCFSSATALEAAIAAPAADGLAITAAYGPNDYVTVYSDATYGGSYMHISQNYDTLFWIGWSDRISSYKVRNNQRGTFWEDWYGGGRRTDFCCNSTVPWLVPEVDNTFTSVYRA